MSSIETCRWAPCLASAAAESPECRSISTARVTAVRCSAWRRWGKRTGKRPAFADFLQNSRAEMVVNTAAWADVDGAEPESGNIEGRVHRLNVDYPDRLARLCGELHKHLIHVSTDYVFDGTNADRAYAEDDQTNP